MKLSRTVTYAVSATMQLARERSGHPVPCSRLAAEGKMPERFLLQILRNLVKSGVLRSTRGVEGGYSLARPPEDISVLDIIEAVEGPLGVNHETAADRIGDPGGDTERSDSATLQLQQAIVQIAQKLKLQLDAVKVSHLLSPPE